MKKMKINYEYLVAITVYLSLIVLQLIEIAETSEKILSRKKRFLAFPAGSSFSASICTTIGMVGNPDVNWLSYALNYGVSYNLPNETWVIEASHGFKNKPLSKVEAKRRSRRELYRNMEIAIDSMGFDGKQCILRALCETSQYLYGRKGTMVEELVKTIFSFPGNVLYSNEDLLDSDVHNDHRYQRAFQHGKSIQMDYHCWYYYPNCTFSLMELAFGKYSVQPRMRVPPNVYSFM